MSLDTIQHGDLGLEEFCAMRPLSALLFLVAIKFAMKSTFCS